jgi:hypothetical protein
MARRGGDEDEGEWGLPSVTLGNEEDCVLLAVRNSEFRWAMVATTSARRRLENHLTLTSLVTSQGLPGHNQIGPLPACADQGWSLTSW